MSTTIPTLSIALVAALVGSAAYAGIDTPSTRAQVRAQTMAAIRSGDIDQGNGFTARAMEPGMYPARPAARGLTRTEVEAQLATALQNGEIDQGNGFAARFTEPAMYPATAVAAAPGETRTRVRAELTQALRSGNLPAPGRITMTQREEEFPQLYGQQ